MKPKSKNPISQAGGTARWKGVSAKKRSAEMARVAKLGWAKRPRDGPAGRRMLENAADETRRP